MASPSFHPLRVAAVSRETSDAVSVVFDVPAALADTFRFQPGQYLTVRRDIDGQEVRRSYSICAGPSDGLLRVGIKEVPGGRFSSFANRQLAVGDTVEVMAPEGRFVTDLHPQTGRNALFIAAGSGITPVLSLVKAILEGEPESRVTLVFGNKKTLSVMFREELEDLKSRFRDRFALYHVFSREPQDVELFHGRLDRERLLRFFDGVIDVSSLDEAWLCGPQAMIETARDCLVEAGLPKKAVKFELFGTPGTEATPKAAVAVEDADKVAEVVIQLDGSTLLLDVPFAGLSVLETAHAAGVDVPYSCKGGMCCTCKAKVVEGEVAMDVCYGLEPDEVAEGWVLTCQSHPRTEKVVLDYDSV